MDDPGISVVIPTRNRCPVLRLTLEALARQDSMAGSYEVIIADDGSTDDTQEMLRSCRHPYDLRTFTLDCCGPARARNTAIREARAPRILLLGDDMIPASTNLRIHLEQAGELEIGVQGAIEWDPEIGITDVMRFLAPEGPQFWFQGLVDGSQVSWKSQASSNLSAPRRWFLEEPFDEVFTEACFEDTEMAWRWARRGWQAVFSRPALCLHRHRYDDIESFLARQRRAGRWARLAVRRHPALFPALVAQPVALAPLLAARAGLRRFVGRGRRADLWDLHSRFEFVRGFVFGR